MGVDLSVDWDVYRWVGAGVGSANGIKFGIGYGSDMVSSYVLFDGLNDCKPVGSFLYGQLE